jgi:hypothetical protein
VSFAFNLGVGNLKKSTLLKKSTQGISTRCAAVQKLEQSRRQSVDGAYPTPRGGNEIISQLIIKENHENMYFHKAPLFSVSLFSAMQASAALKPVKMKLKRQIPFYGKGCPPVNNITDLATTLRNIKNFGRLPDAISP